MSDSGGGETAGKRLGFSSYSNDGTPGLTISDVTLDSPSFASIKSKMTIVGDLSPILFSFLTVQRNYAEFVEGLREIHTTLGASGVMDLFKDEPVHAAKAIASHRVSNFLSSASAFLKGTENALSQWPQRLDSEVVAWHKTRKRLHKESFAYRFLYELRNFNQHASIPISAVTASAKNVQNPDQFKFSTSVTLKTKDLLSRNYTWNSKVKEEIVGIEEPIDISPLVSEFHSLVQELYILCLEFRREDIRNCFEAIDEIRSLVGAREDDIVLYFDEDPIPQDPSSFDPKADIKITGAHPFPTAMLKTFMRHCPE